MVVTVMGQILALSAVAVLGLLVHRLARLDLTLACLLAGGLAGIGLQFTDFDTGIRADSLREVVFFLILPVLIYEAAWHIKPALLKRWLLPILLLATVGVLISTFVTAGLVYWGVGHPQGFPWIAALLVGAILAATDPVAVIAQLRAVKAPEDLTTLFEGESLFNDASGIVLFGIVIALATGDAAGQQSYVGLFALVFFGGIIFGVIAGLLCSLLMLVIASAAANRFILVFSAFATFYVAEHMFHVSGILAVMMAALVTRFALKEVEETICAGVTETWEWLGLFFNCVLFVVMGLVITFTMFVDQWLAMLIAIGATLVARIAAVFICSWLSRVSASAIPANWNKLLVWGGLRGAIAVALVLSLPTSLPYWWTIQSMVFGVVIFSLVVQGSSNKFLLKSTFK